MQGIKHLARRVPHEVDCTIIGSGIVGMSIAAKLSSRYRVLLVDSQALASSSTYHRNSGVMHSGIYYPSGSLKRELCIEGRKLLIEHGGKHNVRINKCGKYIVAMNDSEESYLNKLYYNAKEAGINVEMSTWENLNKIEPLVKKCKAVLHVKDTSIISVTEYVNSLEYLTKEYQVDRWYNHTIIGAKEYGQYLIAYDKINCADKVIKSKIVINSAGLHSDLIAKLRDPSKDVEEEVYWCKGEYYRTTSGVKNLIYPCPDVNLKGLGVHTTIDLSGNVKFGPNAIYVDRPYNLKNIKFDENGCYSPEVFDIPTEYFTVTTDRPTFLKPVQNYLNVDVENDGITPGIVGIRPKLSPENEPAKDFVINKHVKNDTTWIDLFGIESPGLTSSLSIAKYVEHLLK